MQGKILVTYATRTGSTADVAKAIAGRLCDAGLAVQSCPLTGVQGLDGCAGAVLGSAVRYADWLPEMIDWMAAERDRLAQIPVAFFTMHMLALGDEPAARAERARYTAKARDLISPVDEGFFAGMIDLSRLSFVDRLAVRLVKSPVGDRRDWTRIAAWADGLAHHFAGDGR